MIIGNGSWLRCRVHCGRSLPRAAQVAAIGRTVAIRVGTRRDSMAEGFILDMFERPAAMVYVIGSLTLAWESKNGVGA